MLSTHKVEVVQVFPKLHPNAEKLEICEIFDGGYTCCCVKDQFQQGALAAYIPPDSVVEVARPEFAFLKKGEKTMHRIRAMKLRGIQSFGLLVPAPDGSQIGDDVAEFYGVTHYEPVLANACSGGEVERVPDCLSHLSKYDVDSLRRYKSAFVPGEYVMATEKIHGASSRFSWVGDRMYCGSRAEWKREDDKNMWWRVLAATPSIRDFCYAHPGYVLYGEVYGQVQNLKYGTKSGEIRFAAFDVLDTAGKFKDAWEGRGLCEAFHVPCVPLLSDNPDGFIPFDFDAVCALAEGPSLIPSANHLREGCVVKPITERWFRSCGRVCLKIVSAKFLEKSE